MEGLDRVGAAALDRTMSLVHDVDDLWFVVYEGYLYTADLQALVCGRCEDDVKASISGDWVVRICKCMVLFVSFY
jgi:hypothetical protein